jgi:hypothetical protein
MRDGSECKQLADECRKLATTAASPEHKKKLEEMQRPGKNSLRDVVPLSRRDNRCGDRAQTTIRTSGPASS